MAKKRLPEPDPLSAAHPWLLLLYQIPARPSRARVKTWRRLQKIGALQIKNSAYLLPNSPQAREDFEWMRAEIVAMKGEAVVFAAEDTDASARDEIIAGFQSARDKDFQALGEAILEAVKQNQKDGLSRPSRQRLKTLAKTFQERLNEIEAIDLFRAPGRKEAVATLARLERLLMESEPKTHQPSPPGGSVMPEQYRNRVWLTRPRPGIDRMSSAWLIQRFIDPRARFSFADKPKARSKAIPFDMYGVEFSHHGHACTFETLVAGFRIKDTAVNHLARIVHNLDLKDEEFQAPEAVAVGKLVEGLRQMYRNDGQLLREGIKMFEALYRSFGGGA